MAITRLTRPHQSWFLAYEAAFADWRNPTVLELNDRRFVHPISCALNEDGTEMTKGDSETDDTVTFCSIGNESSATFANFTASLQWLKDANTGGSGSTVDLTSGFNRTSALLGKPDIPYYLISRTGPTGVIQDSAFAAEQVISYAKFLTDYPQDVLEQNSPVQGLQNLVFQGQYMLNYHIAA